MNKIILGVVLGLVLGVSGSVVAKTKTNDPQFVVVGKAEPAPLSAEEQIKLGHIYDQYTGKKLKVELSETEIRFRAIEARLEKLEKKK